jgi:tRNA(Ile)-lysidine synthase
MKAGYKVGVAHCNFQLRGAESDGDEQMVKSVCAGVNVPFFSETYETAALAEQNYKSIQVMARELRYGFFSDIAEKNQYEFIATAHHVNDNLETIILNLVRGTGIEGLGGIAVKKQKLIRPMLFASHAMIREYAVRNDLSWREDSSNATDDYNRNFIRHMVIPRLKEINPALEDTFAVNSERISAGISLARKALAGIRAQVLSQEERKIVIDRKKLLGYENAPVILWELIKSYGFNYDQCRLILKEHQPGKRFIAGDQKLTVDREMLIMETEHERFDEVAIGKDEIFGSNGRQKLLFHEQPIENFAMKKDHRVAQLDSAKVKFPLTWRPWKAGDTIMPLGMAHQKKVSDMLIDSKMSLPDKEKITVLQSGNDIIWVVGVRIDDRYKVTDQTRKVLIIEMN